MRRNEANKILMEVAFSQFNVKEIVGKTHEQDVVNYFHEIGHKWVNDDETPWCAAFWNWVAKEAGAEKTGKLNAQSFLDIGEEIQTRNARYGDTVILWRGSPTSAKGHVGGLVGWSPDGSKVYLLGGNQGNRVQIAAYDASRIKGIRRLSLNYELAKEL